SRRSPRVRAARSNGWSRSAERSRGSMRVRDDEPMQRATREQGTSPAAHLGRVARAQAAAAHPTAAVLASLAAVALITALIDALQRWIPVLSLGVLYMLAVLPVAAVWGLAYAVAVS